MKETLAVIAGVIVIGGLVFGLGRFSLEYRKAYEPANRALDRKVFEESPSFVHGKTQDLNRFRREYEQSTDPAEKEALAREAINTASTVDKSKLPSDIRSWVDGL